MNAPQVFAFDSHAVRVLDRSGEPWFVATDVAGVLGYRNAPDMVRMLDEDEAATHNVRSRSVDGVEQDREVTIISESGLYACILKSRRPEAKAFRKWVTAEVLPSIRKTGCYTAPQMPRRDDPLSISHRADIFVGADRVFRATMRAARSAGLSTGAAVRRAQAVTLDRTGIDMLAELQVEPPEDPPPIAADDDPGGVRAFLREWSNGELPVPYTLCQRSDLHMAYEEWVGQQEGQRYRALSAKAFAYAIRAQAMPDCRLRPLHITVLDGERRRTVRAWVPGHLENERRRISALDFDTREWRRFHTGLMDWMTE